MGTSKGYITPTTVHWTQAKTAVNRYAKNRDESSRIAATSKFARAMHRDLESSAAFVNSASEFLKFAKAISHNGLNDALQKFNRSDLIGKTSEEIFNELLNEFTNQGSTTEDYLSAGAISSALRELDISEIEQLKDVSPDVLLQEILIEYIKLSFAFRYEEEIQKKKSPAQTKQIILEMNKYVSTKLHEELELQDLKNTDFNEMQASQIVKRALEDAYQVFEMFYGEE